MEGLLVGRQAANEGCRLSRLHIHFSSTIAGINMSDQMPNEDIIDLPESNIKLLKDMLEQGNYIGFVQFTAPVLAADNHIQGIRARVRYLSLISTLSAMN